MTRFVNRARPGTVRLWMVHPASIWDALEEKGTLWVEPRFDASDDRIIFGEAYDWMREQMRRRLPDYDGHYPWWAYDFKLDLRSWKFHGDEVTPQVRLELAVPREHVLLSAYGDWHCVLNKWYLPQAIDQQARDLEEMRWLEGLAASGASFCRGPAVPEPWHSRLMESWERIFDVDDLRETDTIQACFERLDLADVVRVTEFLPRFRGIG